MILLNTDVQNNTIRFYKDTLFKKKTIKFLILLLTVIPFFSLTSARTLIMNIYVDSGGISVVYGSYENVTIHLPSDITLENGSIFGTSDYLTNKYGPVWVFNLSIDASFDYCIFLIYLPKDASIKKIDSDTLDTTIDVVDDGLRVTAQGWGVVYPSVVVEYNLSKRDTKSNIETFFDLKIIAYLVVVLCFLIFVFFIISKINVPRKKLKINQEKLDTILTTLNDRERDIVTAIIKFGNRSSQNELQTYLDIPRASISRILENLYAKRVIKKWKVGKTNKVELHDSLFTM